MIPRPEMPQISDYGYPEYRRTEKKMSDVLWCDIDDPETNVPHQIGHAFTAKDVNRRHWMDQHTESVPTGNSYGRTTFQDREVVTTEIDICGYHWAKQNPFRSNREENPPEIEADIQDENYLRGYHDGILKGEK